MTKKFFALAFAFAFLSILAKDNTAIAQTPAPAATKHEIEVNVTQQWTDTNLDLRPGARVLVTASGTATYPPAKDQTVRQSFGPEGLARNWADLLHQYPVPDGGRGALIGRLGTGNGAQPFLINARKEYEAPVAGRLFLGINQSVNDAASATGSFRVTVEVVDPGKEPAAGTVAGAPSEKELAAITPAFLEKIPRRVLDQQGNAGDLVNVLLVGSQDDVVAAFTSSGWVHVDSSVQTTVVSGLLNSLQKKSYLTMPMSILYLFDRPQDYGFAHAEPVKVVMARNHLRVWKSPFAIEGQPVWCVAATHDVGFERDQRNNSVTHKIDPNVDLERQFVNDTLASTGMVVQRTLMTPPNPVTEAKTATGGSFHSDGKILVMVVKGK